VPGHAEPLPDRRRKEAIRSPHRRRRGEGPAQASSGRRVLGAAQQPGVPAQPLTDRCLEWRPLMIEPRAALDRRALLKASLAALPLAGWLRGRAADAAAHPQRRRSCILLWMAGGPSQIDTFDPKPGQPTGGPLGAIATSVPGIGVSELLPGLA